MLRDESQETAKLIQMLAHQTFLFDADQRLVYRGQLDADQATASLLRLKIYERRLMQ